MKATVSIMIDTDTLAHVDDQYLASLWIIAQENPVDDEDQRACELVAKVGREIIKRFLVTAGAPLFNHASGVNNGHAA